MANRELGQFRKPFVFDGDVSTFTAVPAGTVNGSVFGTDLGSCDRVEAILHISTITAGAVGDTIDVSLQATWNPYDASPIWFDVVSFTQFLGNAATPIRRLASLTAGQTTSTDVTGNLAAGSNRHLPGVQYRVRYVITDAAGGDLRVTFSVSLLAKSP